MTDKANAEMAKFWNGEGGQKWVGREDRLEASLQPFGQCAIDAAMISGDERGLDIGFGCGETTIQLAAELGPGGHVHGLDISTTMVEAAQNRAKRSAVKNISFECADAQTSALPENHYDFVFSRFGVMFFDDPVTAFKNIYRSLKPGGRLVFMCWAGRDDNAWVRLPLEVVANYISVPALPPSGTPGPFSLSDETRVKSILNEAGFCDVAVEPFQTPFVLGADVDEAVSYLMELSPTGGAIRLADPDGDVRASIADELAALLDSHNSESGITMDASGLLVTARKV
ncbi:MAG: methyltransferase domain-containing protein [Porticoccaceae bacterium]|nr:methyltransferase domain-containing protein [Porticoccaceae bacterium]